MSERSPTNGRTALGSDELQPPRGLRASQLEIGEEKYLVVSFPKAAVPLPDALSPAEREIAAAVMEGASSEEIARARGTSTRTVANQLSAIYGRLGVQSRRELVLLLTRASEGNAP